MITVLLNIKKMHVFYVTVSEVSEGRYPKYSRPLFFFLKPITVE